MNSGSGRISAGDIIQMSNDFYIVNEVGGRQIEVTMGLVCNRPGFI